MAKVLYYLETPNVQRGLSSFLWATRTMGQNFFIDVSEGFITAENVDEDCFEKLTLLVSDYYSISFIEKYTASGYQKLDSDDVMELLSRRSCIEDFQSVLNKLQSTIIWARTKKNAPTRTIVDLIYSTIRILSMEYSSPETILDLDVGDVVEVNFGLNLCGETSGNHTHAIVCNIDNDMVFLVPLIRSDYADRLLPSWSIPLNMPDDVSYFDRQFTGGVALLRKAKYVRIVRINTKIGKANPNFMTHLLSELPKAFDFRTINS